MASEKFRGYDIEAQIVPALAELQATMRAWHEERIPFADVTSVSEGIYQRMRGLFSKGEDVEQEGPMPDVVGELYSLVMQEIPSIEYDGPYVEDHDEDPYDLGFNDWKKRM